MGDPRIKSSVYGAELRRSPHLGPADTATLKDHANSLFTMFAFLSMIRHSHLCRTATGGIPGLTFGILRRVAPVGRFDTHDANVSFDPMQYPGGFSEFRESREGAREATRRNFAFLAYVVRAVFFEKIVAPLRKIRSSTFGGFKTEAESHS